ncbi:MAG: hypothetical protein ISS43_01245 [Candidatus Omnitrophica bacterium]|nr:hypothetical protein [Candidatus Omnitrophota bacterium]
MTDEAKKGLPAAAKTMLKIIAGIVLLVVGVLLIWAWSGEVLTVIKGFLGMAVILAGIVLLAIARE